MALTDLGIQYICINFGDSNNCCVKTGLSWYYIAGGTQYNETGGTAQVVSRLASGLVDSVTMTNPARGTFTQAELNTANNGVVTIQDCQTITEHDTPDAPGGQWCFIPCSSRTDKTTCEYYGCYWYNNACHDNPPSCTELNNQTDCAEYGCYWWNNACHPAQPSCPELTTKTECEQWGCYWYNGSCHATLPACPDITTESECLAYGCFWYRGQCHSQDQNPICYWMDVKGGPDSIQIPNVFEIIDAYLYSSPPPGWTFLPTIQQVMGVIDYYLGFISSGNQNTGCGY